MAWTTIGCREETKAVLLAVIEEQEKFGCPDDFLREVLNTEEVKGMVDNEDDFKKMQEVDL